MKTRIATLMFASLIAASSRAEVLTLLPVADSTVDALNPDMAFPTGNLEAAMLGRNEDPATELTFLYAQYQLPDGLTGQDIASVNSLNFQVRRASESTPRLNLTYYVYGINDGVDSESADMYTWNDGVGYDPTHNEVRFPHPEEIAYYFEPAEAAFLGGLDTTSSGPTTRPFGFYSDEFQSPTALQNRIDLILQDTDGRITLYMKVRPNFDVTPLQMFASLENTAGILAPQLVIDYVPDTSEPLVGDYNDDGAVDAADYIVWRRTLGSTTDLRANGDDTGASMGVIDNADYAAWTANFGASGSGAVLQGSAAVPEAASIAILLTAIPAVCGTRFRTRI